jgi:AAA+ superfamily predicted ATPase
LSGDGISLRCKLTGSTFAGAWAAIKIPSVTKDRLVAQSLLILTVRQKLTFERAPLHGLILLVGPPGTGKTTLAQGLAYQIARHLPKNVTTFVQVDPHALASAALGSSQKAVTKLFEQTLPEAALSGAAVVLLDELETLAADRQRLSLDANPVDVHRATNAVLTGLDNLTRQHKNILVIGTSNFPKALDRAIVSRADLIEDIGLPNEEARRDIVLDTLAGIGEVWSKVKSLEADVGQFAKLADGLDGRALRKAILAAAGSDTATAQDLNKLNRNQIEAAIRNALDVQKAMAK